MTYRERMIRQLMTQGGCFETFDKLHLRIGRRIPNAAGRVAALSLAWDMLNGGKAALGTYPPGLEGCD